MTCISCCHGLLVTDGRPWRSADSLRTGADSVEDLVRLGTIVATGCGLPGGRGRRAQRPGVRRHPSGEDHDAHLSWPRRSSRASGSSRARRSSGCRVRHHSAGHCVVSDPVRPQPLPPRAPGSSVTGNPRLKAAMLELTPVSSALAALIIDPAVSGCGAGPVDPVSATTARATAAAGASRAAQEAAAAEAAAAARAAAAASARVAKPAPAPAAAKTYANCTTMHVDHKGGVARPGAVDHRSSGHANHAPVYSTALHNANKGSDRGADGIACEA